MGTEAGRIVALLPGVVGHDEFCRALARASGAGGVSVLRVGAGDADADTVGRWLRAHVRAGDTIGWLGVAGFAVLPAGAGLEQARCMARRLAGALGTPVGVARAIPGEDATAILRRLCAPNPPDSTRPGVVAAD